jgi:N-acetylneuraminate synthase
LEPAELVQLVVETERAWSALGKVSYGPTDSERKSLQFRRSMYVTSDMLAGERFSAANLRAIRPGLGLSPKYYEMLLGKRVNRDIKRGTPISLDMIG